MKASARLLAVLNAVFMLSALGCGDEGGGCGPAPQKEQESSGGGMSAPAGSGGGSAELVTSDRRGKVPKPYQRPKSAYEPAKSTATISAPVIAASSAAAPGPAKRSSLPVARVVKRRVDGVIDRVEVTCRIMASSPDGKCSSASNYDEIKARCCPDGLVERCTTSMSGVVLVGRGCASAK